MKYLFLSLGLLVFVSVDLAKGQSAYLPAARQTEMSVSYSYSSFDEFYGNGRTFQLSDFGLETIRQQNVSVTASYGITPELAVDVTLGYVGSWTSIPALPGTPTNINGLDDTTLGVRWKVLDESATPGSWIPTVTLRGAGIIAGTYEPNLINSPGNGGSGGEYGFLFGKYYEPWEAGLYGNLYQRIVSNSVPQQLDFTVGAYRSFFQCVNLYAGYRHLYSFSGVDVAGPGFAFDKLNQLREITDSIQGGITYTDPGGRNYSVNVAQILAGENAAKSLTLNFSFGFQF